MPDPKPPPPRSLYWLALAGGWFSRALLALLVVVVLLAAWRCSSAVVDHEPRRRALPAMTTTTLSHSLQCRADTADIQNTTRLVGLELDYFTQAAAIGDNGAAQIHYDNATLLGDAAITRVDAVLARCANYARSEGIYNGLQQGSATAKSALAAMRRTCRADLAAFGFDC